MTEERKNVRISLTPEYIDMLDAIALNRGGLNRPEAMRNLIYIAYSRMNKAADQINEGEKLPQVKLYKQTIPDKKEAEHQNKLDICAKLNGEEVEGSCRYWKYDGKDRFLQEVLVNDLTQTHLEEQYLPSRVIVEDLQRRGLASYDINEG